MILLHHLTQKKQFFRQMISNQKGHANATFLKLNFQTTDNFEFKTEFKWDQWIEKEFNFF